MSLNFPDALSEAATSHPLLLGFGVVGVVLAVALLLVHSRRSLVSSVYRVVTDRDAVTLLTSSSSPRSSRRLASDESAVIHGTHKLDEAFQPPLTYCAARLSLRPPGLTALASQQASSASSSPSSSAALSLDVENPSSAATNAAAVSDLRDPQLNLSFPGAIQLRRIVEVYTTDDDMRGVNAPEVALSPGRKTAARGQVYPVVLNKGNYSQLQHLLPPPLKARNPEADVNTPTAAVISHTFCRSAIWLSVDGNAASGGRKRTLKLEEAQIRAHLNLFVMRPIGQAQLETLPKQLKDMLSSNASLSPAPGPLPPRGVVHPRAASPFNYATSTALYFGQGSLLTPRRGDVRVSYYEVPYGGSDDASEQEGDFVSVLAELSPEGTIVPYEKHVAFLQGRSSHENGSVNQEEKKEDERSALLPPNTRQTSSSSSAGSSTFSAISPSPSDSASSSASSSAASSRSSTPIPSASPHRSLTSPAGVAGTSRAQVQQCTAQDCTLLSLNWSTLFGKGRQAENKGQSVVDYETQPILYIDAGIVPYDSVLSKRVKSKPLQRFLLRLSLFVFLILSLELIVHAFGNTFELLLVPAREQSNPIIMETIQFIFVEIIAIALVAIAFASTFYKLKPAIALVTMAAAIFTLFFLYDTVKNKAQKASEVPTPSP